MIILTMDEIIHLYDKMIEQTGGLHGLRDKGLLESAIFSAAAYFDDVELYPSVEEKAARLAFALTSNHPFVDGNKRIGILVMLITLELNNKPITFTQQELIKLGLGIASGQCRYADILNWILERSKNG